LILIGNFDHGFWVYVSQIKHSNVIDKLDYFFIPQMMPWAKKESKNNSKQQVSPQKHIV